ncbi:UNVERIFIED_CONTAM: hypothetical protein K2H54_009829 [Gekko kuhli]
MAEEGTLLPADPECSSPRLAETPTVEELEELLNTGRPSGNLGSAMSLAGLPIRDHDPAQPQSEKGNVGTSALACEAGRIVVYLPTCQPEDPGTRDASVQVGVTCEDKATQWEEREEADPSLDKSSGANSTTQPVFRAETPTQSCFNWRKEAEASRESPSRLDEEAPRTPAPSALQGGDRPLTRNENRKTALMHETQAPPGASGKCREKQGQRKQQAFLTGLPTAGIR